MNVDDAIRLKRAVRKFTDQPLSKEIILAILNAGRRAQSSKNSQPWHFISITDRSTLNALSECGEMGGVGKNNAWHLAGAALGVALLSEDPDVKFQTMFDLGQAAAYMQLAAWELGIGSCLASIYQAEQARQLLDFPTDLHLCIAISFGYPADEGKLVAAPRQGGRKSLDEMLHWDHW